MGTDTKNVMENNTTSVNEQVLSILLMDRSTKKNIVWATDDYISLGVGYSSESEITIDKISGFNSFIITPRVLKERQRQSNRTRNKAEVFTPSWICNEQNNLVDEQWFGRTNIFNMLGNKKWKTNKEKIVFPSKVGKTWQDYIRAKRMEITCGEAPYLVSRYDTVTGNTIQICDRIGLLDRKLRIINENVTDESDWFLWAKKAYQSIYGYEYQGDNLVIARKNLLMTFIDNVLYKFNRQPTNSELKSIAYIISWNIWQMDGLTYTAPYSEMEVQDEFEQLTLFGFEEAQEQEDIIPINKNAIPCIIRDWTNKCNLEYRSMLK